MYIVHTTDGYNKYTYKETETDTDSVVLAQIQIAQYEYVSHNLGISTT